MRFEAGDAQALPLADSAVDVAVSGLVLNFVPDPARALGEMARVVRPGGAVALYVWDYAGEMQLMRRFWDAATALDPSAEELDEGVRFPICRPEPLAALFADAGLEAVATRPIEVATVFADFDDYWSPFLGGQGPAPGYCMSLPRAAAGSAARAAAHDPARRRRRPHRAGRPSVGRQGHRRVTRPAGIASGEGAR